MPTIHCISKLLLFSLKFSLKQVFLEGRQIEGLQRYQKMRSYKYFQMILRGFAIFQYLLT